MTGFPEQTRCQSHLLSKKCHIIFAFLALSAHQYCGSLSDKVGVSLSDSDTAAMWRPQRRGCGQTRIHARLPHGSAVCRGPRRDEGRIAKMQASSPIPSRAGSTPTPRALFQFDASFVSGSHQLPDRLLCGEGMGRRSKVSNQSRCSYLRAVPRVSRSTSRDATAVPIPGETVPSSCARA